MEAKKIADLSDKELLRKKKKIKNDKLIGATIVGFVIGIAIYSGVKNGLDFFTFFPLFLVYIFIKSSSNNKLLEKEIEIEIEARNLK
ncbi:hypothetical protein [uncultured Draconibacterium sp.]|uniref:hypothetical protein n=1 Tax=uncultured Draconibacterium sp. TaxID=1573823 RepID=UPI0025E5425B|nr:hypothetical protein [uncultured Draconibacterium sp.]